MLLDYQTRKYGISLLTKGHSHPLFQSFLQALMASPIPFIGTGLRRVASLLFQLLPASPPLEDLQSCSDFLLPIQDLEISPLPKETTAVLHRLKIPTLSKCLLVYTDGSKSINGMVSSGWAIFDPSVSLTLPITTGGCNIGTHAEVIDGETHAIQEALSVISPEFSHDSIYLFIDNQMCLNSLTGGPTYSQQYLQQTLLIIQKIRHSGRSVTAVWTPSHVGIKGNDLADAAAQSASTLPTCQWARVTLAWLRAAPRKFLLSQWQNSTIEGNVSREFSGMSSSLRYPVAQLLHKARTSTNAADYNPLSPEVRTCPCGNLLSSNHLLLECTRFDQQREAYAREIGGDISREQFLFSGTSPISLLRFLKQIGLFSFSPYIVTDDMEEVSFIDNA